MHSYRFYGGLRFTMRGVTQQMHNFFPFKWSLCIYHRMRYTWTCVPAACLFVVPRAMRQRQQSCPLWWVMSHLTTCATNQDHKDIKPCNDKYAELCSAMLWEPTLVTAHSQRQQAGNNQQQRAIRIQPGSWIQEARESCWWSTFRRCPKRGEKKRKNAN